MSNIFARACDVVGRENLLLVLWISGRLQHPWKGDPACEIKASWFPKKLGNSGQKHRGTHRNSSSESEDVLSSKILVIFVLSSGLPTRRCVAAIRKPGRRDLMPSKSLFQAQNWFSCLPLFLLCSGAVKSYRTRLCISIISMKLSFAMLSASLLVCISNFTVSLDDSLLLMIPFSWWFPSLDVSRLFACI